MTECYSCGDVWDEGHDEKVLCVSCYREKYPGDKEFDCGCNIIGPGIYACPGHFSKFVVMVVKDTDWKPEGASQ